MSKETLALRIRKAEVDLLHLIEQWLRAKDGARDVCAEQILDGLHGTAAILFDMRGQLGLPSYIRESIDIDEELGDDCDA
jgi:hypothetical protein